MTGTKSSPAGKRKRTHDKKVNITFSVTESALAELKRAAHLHDMTISQKINFLLLKNMSFQRQVIKNNGVHLPAEPIHSLLKTVDEEKAVQFVETSILEVAS